MRQPPISEADIDDTITADVPTPEFDTPVFDRAAPGKRSVSVIQAEYEATQRRFIELRQLNDRQWEHRQKITGMHDIARSQWGQNPITKGRPFDPALCPGLLPIPPEDTKAARDLHKIQYALALLTKELTEAKRELV